MEEQILNAIYREMQQQFVAGQGLQAFRFGSDGKAIIEGEVDVMALALAIRAALRPTVTETQAAQKLLRIQRDDGRTSSMKVQSSRLETSPAKTSIDSTPHYLPDGSEVEILINGEWRRASYFGADYILPGDDEDEDETWWQPSYHLTEPRPGENIRFPEDPHSEGPMPPWRPVTDTSASPQVRKSVPR